MGIYSIKKVAAAKAKGKEKGVGVGIRASYLRVVGIQVDTEGAGGFLLLIDAPPFFHSFSAFR